MKRALFIFLLTFCTVTNAGGWRSFGDLEFLNDIGLEQTRSHIKTIYRTLSVLGYTNTSNRSTPARINRGYGNANSTVDFYSGRKIKSNEAPFVVQEVQDTIRYIK